VRSSATPGGKRRRLSGSTKRRPVATQREKSTANLQGKIALVTGASQGIGLAIARALVASGCKVIITGHNRKSLDRAAKALQSRGEVLPIVCDVRDADAVTSLFAEIRRKYRRLDILINNAGIAHPNLPVASLPADVWRDVFETNLTGMFFVTRAALPLMKRGGVIVNNLSIAAKRIFAGSAAYDASKHAALALTTSLREELRPEGIRVIALLPGATDTAIWNTIWPDAPRKKMMSPKTVARAVVDLLRLPDNSTVEELVILPTGGAL